MRLVPSICSQYMRLALPRMQCSFSFCAIESLRTYLLGSHTIQSSSLSPIFTMQEAEKIGKAPDFLYCKELLENTGIVTVPGSGFRQVSSQLELPIQAEPALFPSWKFPYLSSCFLSCPLPYNFCTVKQQLLDRLLCMKCIY